MDIQYLIKTFWLSLKGVPVTLSITFLAMLLGTPFALYFAHIKMKSNQLASRLVNGYVTVIRSTPMILQILIVYSLLPSLLNRLVKYLGLSINIFKINPIFYAVIVFTFSAVAALTEIYRSAILAVDSGQKEAALASGLSDYQANWRIIYPQALQIALPNLCNLVIYLVKGTSLVFIMTVKDITAIAKVEASFGYNYIESYLDVLLIYLIICSVIQVVFQLVESGLKYPAKKTKKILVMRDAYDSN